MPNDLDPGAAFASLQPAVPVDRRGFIVSALGAGFALAVQPVMAQTAIQTDTAGLLAGEVKIPTDDGDMPAYRAQPAQGRHFPVVLVVQEIFGVHAYIQDVCRRLAKAGYAAIAPPFFVRVEDPAPLSDMTRIREIVSAAKYEQVMGDIAATLDWTSQQLWARDDKVGITGFCWGGKVVWQAAARFAVLGAGVAWYGRLAPAPDATPVQIASGQPWPVDLADDLTAPVLGLYGGQDQGIPLASVERMRQALTRAGQTHSEIVVYPDAPHGFHADYRDSYRAADAADGWRRLLAFFDARMKG